MSERPHPTASRRRRSTSRGRDVFLEAGAGHRQDRRARRPLLRRCHRGRDPARADARLHLHRAGRRAAAPRVRAELAPRAEPSDVERLPPGSAGRRAWITTIHGFCRRLLAAHPVAAGIDPRFRVLDAHEATALARARLRRGARGAARQRRRTPSGRAVAAYRVDGLRDVVSAGAYEELRSRGEAEPELPEPPPTTPPAALASARDVRDRRRRGEVEQPKRRHGRARRWPPPGARPGRTSTSSCGQALDAKDGAKQECLDAIKRAAARAGRPPRRGELACRPTGAARAPSRLFGEPLRGSSRRTARASTSRTCSSARSRCSRDSEPSATPTASRFRHLLVDEFQDTNALQLGLIEQLRGPDTRAVLVGDEFQSIYGFRHADLDVFRAPAGALRAGGTAARGAAADRQLPLAPGDRRRRQRPRRALLGDDFEPLTVGAAAEAAGGRRARRRAAAHRGREGLGRPEDGAAAAGRRPHAARARSPRRGCSRSGCASSPTRRVAPAEMVVLLRAFTHVDAYRGGARPRRPRPYVVGGRGYWSQQQVEDMRCLLAVVANPLDDEPLLGALASPACGVCPDTLWLLRRAAAGETRELRPAL